MFANRRAAAQRNGLACETTVRRGVEDHTIGNCRVLSFEETVQSVFQKLNLKDQKQIVVLNPPASFEKEIAALEGIEVLRDLKKARQASFSLAFVTTQDEVNRLAPAIARKAEGDAVVWFAYPKGSSKKYKSQINRDNGWDILGQEGFEPVRMVAIDEDWSAVRFRRAGFVKNMIRANEHRLTERAKGAKARS
jgi:hypothetical protein